MLTLFRRIRKGLLGSGGTRKYLLYAIGEIALVVIGILIALQINNWNEWRKDRIEERIVLFDIRNALDSDLDGEIIPYLSRLEKSVTELSSVLYHIDHDLPYQDSLNNYFFHLTYLHEFDPQITAYKTLESKGIDLLLDKEIKDAVLDLYNTEYPFLTNRVENHMKNVQDFGRPFVRRNFHSAATSDSIRLVGLKPIDFKELKRDPEFRNLIVFQRANNFAQLQNMQRLVQKIGDLTMMIDDKL